MEGLSVQPHHSPRGHPPGTPAALLGRGSRYPAAAQRGFARSFVREDPTPHARVNDEVCVGDGDAGFRNVGGQDDFTVAGHHWAHYLVRAQGGWVGGQRERGVGAERGGGGGGRERKRRRRRRIASICPTYSEPVLRPSQVPRGPGEGVLRLTSAGARFKIQEQDSRARMWLHT